MTQTSGNDADASALTAVAPWLEATIADLGNWDFETPIADSSSAATHDLCERFIRAAKAARPETAEARLFTALSAVTGMHLKAREREEPFGPMVTWADGRRSGIPADFRDRHIELLAGMAMRSANKVLRARLADICWLLDRQRVAMGPLAIAAYVDTVLGVETGALTFPLSENDGALDHRNCEFLRRALHIGKAIGWEKPEVLRARNTAARLRKLAAELKKPHAILWFAELDVEFGVSDPAEVADDIEQFLSSSADVNVHFVISLWRLAARAHHLGKQENEKHRCQVQAAEAMAGEAERIFSNQDSKQGAALHALHFMSDAIAGLHGIPRMKDRRTALRHRLIDIQALIPDEMSTFVHRWDFSEIKEKVQGAFNKASLLEKLFTLAAISSSPDPATLIAEAKEAIKQHPLSSLFSTVYFDRDGKAVHRSQGLGAFGDASEDAIRGQIAQAESIRRNLASATIEMARVEIMSRHFMPEDVLVLILQQSPFVPRELLGTFSRGFLRFFQGDFTSAAYILTPLLENSLRHVLKMHGYDVTTFDDATQTQQDRPISSLFESMRRELESVFTPAITTDIENVFLNRPGPHLRHDIAHGRAHDGTPYGSDSVYACWLIYRLCLLPLFPYFQELRQLVS